MMLNLQLQIIVLFYTVLYFLTMPNLSKYFLFTFMYIVDYLHVHMVFCNLVRIHGMRISMLCLSHSSFNYWYSLLWYLLYVFVVICYIINAYYIKLKQYVKFRNNFSYILY
jgi:hypothetical protein